MWHDCYWSQSKNLAREPSAEPITSSKSQSDSCSNEQTTPLIVMSLITCTSPQAILGKRHLEIMLAAAITVNDFSVPSSSRVASFTEGSSPSEAVLYLRDKENSKEAVWLKDKEP